MSTVVVGGGGPRPQARIVQLEDMPTKVDAEYSYAIFDGCECLIICKKISHALALLPLIQSGE